MGMHREGAFTIEERLNVRHDAPGFGICVVMCCSPAGPFVSTDSRWASTTGKHDAMAFPGWQQEKGMNCCLTGVRGKVGG